ncbi:DEAD/DEAH box helicase [Ancylobacter defluvii]|uniref:DEAD/DEAH box helicase n=1 Tax=Ancylobacter defluvii TaxID=1282440 RepID=A0A9W6K1Q8_9HYPH|nr:DEAD/DEAH box helicase [Ancylobacter defluvii]MBS7586800.1 DEAD/DEAH box helicase [Ancylobacter defluvii]GLK86105.1 DEAD/DEAH box helicase [Ancylobacter defluvii]
MPFITTNPALARALAEREYNNPTPVQLAVLAPEASDRDLLVSAQTGSGKTVAYGLAMAETLLGTAEHFAPATAPQALVVAPTRELALQVQREFAWLYAATGARIVSCVGGMDARAEQRLLNQGAHIVVGTPGRLRDHLERGRLDLSALRVAVLDEADEMLDLGFREDLEFILDATPPERRSLLFSATMPRGITALAKRYQRDALRIEVASAEGGHADIEYRTMRIAPTELDHAVVNVLRYYDTPSAIVFCNTREAVRRLHAMLQERQFSAVALSGELSQNERNHALQALRDGRARVCVATDVAARGIDLPNLGLVIHADLPNDAESLQHRSGRTGRAGRKGVSVLLVPPFRRRRTEDLMRGVGITPTWSGPPTADDIRKLDHERMLVDPLLADDPSEEDAAAAQTLLAAHSAEHLAAALVRLYRAGLPAPEEVADPGEPRNVRDRGTQRDFGGPSGESGSTWFRLNIGRRNNADPRWLLPLICRRGNVTRKDIGAIRIFDEETAFEVGLAAADRFGKAVRKADGADVIIEPLPGGPSGERSERPARGKPLRGKPPHDKPHHEKPSYEKPFRDKNFRDKPAQAKSADGKPAFGKPAYSKPAHGKAAHGKPAFNKAREAMPSDHSAGERPPKRERPSTFEGKPKGKKPRPS